MSTALDELRESLKATGIPLPELAAGPQARVAAATAPEAGFVMSAIVGVEGLEATYEAVRLAKRVGLANKEVLVASGQLVIDAMRASGAELIPVDSEHNGAHQCFRAGRRSEVAKLILTASGGPFRETPAADLARVTPEQALNHPTWKMGQRITIDSATLMNKGFEVIEACWLFDLAAEGCRSGGASAVQGSRHGGVHRRQRDRAGLGDRHADADPVRADVSGARRCAGAAAGLVASGALDLRSS